GDARAPVRGRHGGRRQRRAGGIDLPVRAAHHQRGQGVPRVARGLRAAGRTDTVTGGWLADTASMYGRVFRRAAELTARSWPIAFLAVGYPMLLAMLSSVLGPYGFVGGMIWTAAAAACFSSWLYFMEQVVRGRGRVDLRDLAASFGAYLGDVLNFGFLLFLLQLVAAFVLAPFPLLLIVFALAVFVFLNAVPELIYLGRSTGMDLMAESYRFIGTNWIEWFPATLMLVAAVLGADLLLPAGPFGLISAAGAGLVAAFGWVVRGLLFLELTTSSRRAREFRRRAAG